MAFTEKYVTVTGGGLHDGTSEANAWTFTEALAGVSAGDRVNVKAGTHSCSTSSTVNGTNTDQIHIRGYVSTIGDLDETQLGTTAEATGMPLVEVTGSRNGFKGNYTTISHIAFKGMTTNAEGWETGQGSVIRSCRFTNNAGTSQYYNILRGGSYCSLHDCYIEPLSASSGVIGSFLSFSDCVINAPNCAGSIIKAVSTRGCTIIGNGSSVGIHTENAGPVSHIGNTIINCATGIQAHTYNYGITILGCYFSNCTTAISNTQLGTFLISSCCYHNVTTQLSGWDTQYFAKTDSTDQFVDSAADDYTLKPTSNGYNGRKPDATAGFGTTTKRDIGAIRHQDAGGGGGATHYDPFTNPRF